MQGRLPSLPGQFSFHPFARVVLPQNRPENPGAQ